MMFHAKHTHKQLRRVGKIKTTCSKCDGPLEQHRIGVHPYCLKCHALQMRTTRPKHSELPEEARKKATARAYAKVYLKRGWIERKNCEVCGALAEMHHDDYSKPLNVRWLCRPHHLEHHKMLSA